MSTVNAAGHWGARAHRPSTIGQEGTSVRQPWSKTNVDGANFRMTERELDRVYDEMPSLPEPPAQAEGSGGATDGPPRSQAQTIAPPPETAAQPTECANPACAGAFQNAAETGAPLVEGSGSGCTDRRVAHDPSKVPSPDRRAR